ncbi:cytochrome P450 family protein [Saccharomonospora cyanea]|uniref:Cytochrome P450 n=1 Tax=Saccharomonospora cyanea NA-134 TaxID=882082 RepID=H5XCS7_9PSEU|nr:cytochrome P450 [Saccharomonospora cyanea]EHR62321.1 cytochrome P450 [Saccharomonospora cyanea NA-134]
MPDIGTAEIELDDEFIQHPYDLYRELRAQEPVRKVVMPLGMRAWLVTRYADARVALAHPDLRKDAQSTLELYERHMSALGDDRPVFAADTAEHMLNSDPPQHTRLRTLVAKAFTVRAIERMRPRVEEITDGLLDRMAEQRTVNLLDALAFPLPITVICEMLGIPEHDREDFRRWFGTLLAMGDGDADAVTRASASLAEYLTSLVSGKRRHPGDDLLTELIQASDADHGSLTESELIAMAFLLMIAGHDSTMSLIGNGVLCLLQHPDQLAALRDDPSLVPAAVEEFLRYESPVTQATFRYTGAPVRIGDVEIPEGEFVVVALGSANRDGDRFPDPDRFDPGRDAGGHLAFGHGIHYCLGAPLARMEAQIAIGRLVRRFPDLALAVDSAELRWRDSTLIRGLEELPVSLFGD